MWYALGQFFHLKYVVMYGISSHIARIDGVEAPGHPACISRIFLYSDMWRYFDAGLYEFMKLFDNQFLRYTCILLFSFRYIYDPLIQNMPSSMIYKLFGSAVCFSFVLLL